jgi:hypothetical protein
MATSEVLQQFEDLILSRDYDAALQVLADVKPLITSIAHTSLPLTDRGRALDLHRALCTCIRDACDFAITFERSFANREALLASSSGIPSAAEWIISTLRLTRFAPPNVNAACSALRRLGSSLEGRSEVGRRRGVAVLLDVWRRYSSNIHIVEALVVLCSGHVDNISRFVREDGIEQALGVCESAHTPGVCESEQAWRALKQEALLLLGVCCVCLPDEGRGGKLVTTVVAVLRDAVRAGEYSSRLLVANALGCLANVGEAVARDLYMTRETEQTPLPGYDVPNPDQVVSQIVKAWSMWPSEWTIVSPAAWALVAMKRAGQVSMQDLLAEEKVVASLILKCSEMSSSVRALRRIMKNTDEADKSPADLPLSKSTCDCGATPSRPRASKKRSAANIADVSSPVTPAAKRVRRLPEVNIPVPAEFGAPESCGTTTEPDEGFEIPLTGGNSGGSVKTPRKTSPRATPSIRKRMRPRRQNVRYDLPQ